MTDARPLSVRVRVIARQFAAQAIGIRKRINESRQVAENLDRDAKTLNDAADELERRG